MWFTKGIWTFRSGTVSYTHLDVYKRQLETLHLRVPRHCENAQKVAEFLQGQEDVAWINYPGLPSNKYHDLSLIHI